MFRDCRIERASVRLALRLQLLRGDWLAGFDSQKLSARGESTNQRSLSAFERSARISETSVTLHSPQPVCCSASLYYHPSPCFKGGNSA